MTISAVQTLIVFFCIFGIVGGIRGPNREVWTLVGVTLTLLLLYFGGPAFIDQLPVRLGSGTMALLGNQSASDSLARQQVKDPWASAIVLAAAVGLIALDYYIGNRFGGKEAPKTLGERTAGFIMGALSGTFIALFVFRQGGFYKDLLIQFPNEDLAQQSAVPLIIAGLVIVIIAIAMRRQATSASKK